jgi:hypothetical protein
MLHKNIKNMKTIKFLLIAVLFLAAYSASAQWTDGGIYQTTTDNIGIGTATAPTYLLHVAKNMTGPQIVIQNLGGAGGAGISMIDDAQAGSWGFKSMFGGGFKIRDFNSALDVLVFEKAAKANAIYVKAGGNVGIGTNAPTTALTVVGTISSTGASVNGKITCKEVEVTLTGWPDYVFGKQYHLKPLSEVEKFIKDNGHLPGISSAKEIEQNGLSLGEMNKQLMQKVEELTLYVIQLQKEVDALK